MDPFILGAVGLGLYALVKSQSKTTTTPQPQPQNNLPAPKTELQKLLEQGQKSLVGSNTNFDLGATIKSALPFVSLIGGGAAAALNAAGIALGPIAAVAAFIIVAIASIVFFILSILPFFNRELRRQFDAIKDAVEMFSGIEAQSKTYMIAAVTDQVRAAAGREPNTAEMKAADLLHRAVCLGFAAEWFDCLRKAAKPVSTAQFTALNPDGSFPESSAADMEWKADRGIYLTDNGWDAACYMAFYQGLTKEQVTPELMAAALQKKPVWSSMPNEERVAAGVTLDAFNKAYDNGRRQGNAVFYLKMCSILDSHVTLVILDERWFNAHFFSKPEELAQAANPNTKGISLYKVSRLVTQTQGMSWPTDLISAGVWLPPPECTGVKADEILPNGDIKYLGAVLKVKESIEAKSPVFAQA